MWQADSADVSGAAAKGSELAFSEALAACVARSRSWRVPPNWSPAQWHDEIAGHALAAACDARAIFDPSRGIPLGAFIYQRVMARVLTRYRQEWSFARRCVCELGLAGEACPCGAAPDATDRCDLEEAVASLTSPQRWLIRQIFWRGRTETAVASDLGLSQRAVSKRKQAVLVALRRWLADRTEEINFRF